MSNGNENGQSEYEGRLDTIQDRPYLPAHGAVKWFHKDFPIPAGRIITALLSEKPILWRADIYVGDALVGTAHAYETPTNKIMGKLETNAVRRALAYCGYGTEEAIGDDDFDPETGASLKPAAKANGKPPAERLGNTGERRATRDWIAIFNAVEPHFPEPEVAGRKAHFKELVSKLERAGVLDGQMPDSEVIDVIEADRAAEDKANKSWWLDTATMLDVNKTLRSRHGMDAVAAVKLLGKSLDQFVGPSYFAEAVRLHVLDLTEKQPTA